MPLFHRMGKLFCGSSVNPNFPIRIGGFILHSSGSSEYWGQTQDIWLRFNHFVNKKSSIPVAAVTVPEGTVATLENAAYVYDKTSCRRRKVYKLVSWLMRVAVIVAVCFIIII